MKRTSQLPPDTELMANSDTRNYGEQPSEFVAGQHRSSAITGEEDDMSEDDSAEDDMILDDDDAVGGSTDEDALASSDIEDDGTPVLTEDDLEENDLSEEDADDIEWEEPRK